MDDAAHNPATITAPGSDHWNPKLQRDFLEAFATNGSVKISAVKVGMSPSAVYQLKQRPEGAAFKLGCAAALLIARGRLVDELLDRAIWGHDETTELLRRDRNARRAWNLVVATPHRPSNGSTSIIAAPRPPAFLGLPRTGRSRRARIIPAPC
ncbi:hypothetical protein [Sphingopyxis panaciterrae]